MATREVDVAGEARRASAEDSSRALNFDSSQSSDIRMIVDNESLTLGDAGISNNLETANERSTDDTAVKAPAMISEPPSFPQLSNNAPTPPEPSAKRPPSEGEDEEPAIARGFQRSASPTSALRRNKGAIYEKVGEAGICKMHKFSLYETTSRYYLVGGDITDRKFRILKIDRTADSGDLIVAEDEIVYTKKEMNQLLNAVDDGNRASGGLKLKCYTWGLLGFIRFTGAYYMLLITKRSQVAMIGGHYVYQVDGTELVSLTVSSASRFKFERDAEEARFVGILNNLDLSRSFYFSYSYDITRTLQHNIVRERQTLHKGNADIPERRHNSMFVWNHHLLDPALKALKDIDDWCLPIIHGFVDQASESTAMYDNYVVVNVSSRTLHLWEDGLHHDCCQEIPLLRRCTFPQKRSKRSGCCISRPRL